MAVCCIFVVFVTVFVLVAYEDVTSTEPLVVDSDAVLVEVLVACVVSSRQSGKPGFLKAVRWHFRIVKEPSLPPLQFSSSTKFPLHSLHLLTDLIAIPE